MALCKLAQKMMLHNHSRLGFSCKTGNSMLIFTELHNYYLLDHLTTSNNMSFHQCEGGREKEKKRDKQKEKESLKYWQTAL
jgi:hypothetical protein